MDRTAEPRLPTASLAFAGLAVLMTLPALFGLWFGLDDALARKLAWFASAGAVALGTYAWCVAQGRAKFGLLSTALLAGGAAKLWLMRPLWFPALNFPDDGGIALMAVALVAVQGCVVLWCLRDGPTRASLLSGIAALGYGRLFLLLAFLSLLSVSAMGYVHGARWDAFALQIVAGGAFAGLSLANIALLLHVPAPAVAAPRVAWLVFGVIAAAAALSWLAFQNVPHVEDEVAYLFQARTLQHGAIVAPAPPEAARGALAHYLIDMRDGVWFATTSPGWPAVLAIGTWAGQPWLVNPILSGAILFLAFRVVALVSDRRRASVAALLIAISPWFIETSASLMPHNVALFLTFLSWRLLLAGPAQAAAAVLTALAAGLAMGWVFVTRPFDGVIVGTATGLWLIYRDRSLAGMSRTLAYGLGCIATGSVFLAFNFAITGDLLSTPLSAYLDRIWHPGANAFGFGADIGPPLGWSGLDLYEGHGPFEALFIVLNNLAALNFELFGWATGSLIAIAALFLWGRPTRADWTFAGLCGLIILVLAFYWFSGAFYIGPRYWFELLLPVAFLSSGGIVAVWDRLVRAGADGQAGPAVLAVLAIFSLGVFLPWRGVEKFLDYQRFVPNFAERAATGEFGNDIVFVTYNARPGSFLFLNDPWLPEGKPIFLISRGSEEDAKVEAAFPGRKARHIELTIEK